MEEKKKGLLVIPIFGLAAVAVFFLTKKAGGAMATLTGLVTDHDTGSGIGGITVSCGGHVTTTDDNGHYGLVVSPGTYTVGFYDPLDRYAPLTI